MRNIVLVASALTALTLLLPQRSLAAHVPAYISAAVDDPARPQEDRQRDALRKPAQTLEFAGIKPGERVIELVPGRGYFTRLLSKVVGTKGHVQALSPPRRAEAPADSPDPAAATVAIAADPNYSNVTAQTQPLARISASEPVDVVWTSQNYHDLHNAATIDVAAFNRSVFEALKPGGVYIVLDHAAASGSGTRDTSTLHRIDPATVKAEVEAAGFVLAAQSDLLHNKDDAHTAKVFDPQIRGKTDQFLLKFRKPKK